MANVSAGASKIKALLDAGADVNTRLVEGLTPLMCAAVHGDVATVDVLLKAGADIELQQDNGHMTALMKAALWSHVATVEKLLDAGAAVNKTTRGGFSALMFAGNAQTVRALLGAGADATLKDNRGKTALDHARESDKTKIVELLR